MNTGFENGEMVGIGQQVMDKLKTQGRVVELSPQQSAEIDDTLAQALAPIRREFEQKERACWAYIQSKGW